MFDISKVDKNFTVNTKIEKEDIKFYSADEEPIGLYGVFREGDHYRRMPEEIAKSVNDGVYSLHANTAGGRVRFVTDSKYIAINAVMDGIGKMPHFALTGSAGFDMYIDGTYIKTFAPPFGITTGYEGIYEMAECKMREITINFPLYSCVKELYIGLQDSAALKKAKPYRNEKPVVYYGSSITQGGCAARPGSCYCAIVSRELNLDYINLGFSGSARAEDAVIDYIKGLDMSLFVYDYDHNAPTADYLEATHEKMFLAIRKAHPDLPIIMMSRPKHILEGDEERRLEIIKTTYRNAVAAGDKNVYFIDGKALTALCLENGTVDNCHPTDFGFASMAKAVIELIKRENIEVL